MMQPAIRHGARRALAGANTSSRTILQSRLSPSNVLTRPKEPWTCAKCRFRAQGQLQITVPKRWISSTSRRLRDDPSEEGKATSPSTIAYASTSGVNGTTSSPAPSLPSQTAKQRWEMSDRMTKLMDNILARASIAGQHINAYTGTDYSGIENIRKSIITQEQHVRTSLTAVERAKASQQDEISKQSSSQKEIVSLLERKASWSPSDLERYMALVRSEHVNEQATQGAKDGLATAERELEEARAQLERLERKQYHEEQVWSDTIRRNSTWVTFGLMGVNIVLLLAQILFFEPYRRKKIVKAVKDALDEKTVVSAPIEEPTSIVTSSPVIEPQPPAANTADGEMTQPLDTIFVGKSAPDGPSTIVGEGLSGDANEITEIAGSTGNDLQPQPENVDSWESYLRAYVAIYREKFRDYFSDRVVPMRQVDLTTIALQGVAAGATTVGLLMIVLKQK